MDHFSIVRVLHTPVIRKVLLEIIGIIYVIDHMSVLRKSYYRVYVYFS